MDGLSAAAFALQCGAVATETICLQNLKDLPTSFFNRESVLTLDRAYPIHGVSMYLYISLLRNVFMGISMTVHIW